MSKPILVTAALLIAVAGLPRPSVAQPAPEPVAPQPPPVAPPAPAAPEPIMQPAPAAPEPLMQPAPMGPSSFGPPSQYEPPPAPRPRPAGNQLSESVALQLSLGGTFASWAAFLLGAREDNGPMGIAGLIGTVLLPSAGHWYAGAPVTRGMGVRLVSGAVALYSFALLVGCDDTGCGENAEYYFFGSALLYVAATIDDIVTAPRRVRRHNERLQVQVAPMVTNQSAGLMLGGRF